MSTSIQPVVRALRVLRALNHHPHCSLLELHRATELPKPTLHRLLSTLKAEGYVRSDVARGVYSLTSKVGELSEGFTHYELVVELGRPILMHATRDTGAPMAIGLLEAGRIVVRYSSMPYSPIAPEHTTLGHSHDLVHSAMGQAYMAYCPDVDRSQLEFQLRSACADAEAEQQLRLGMGHMLCQTRDRGYGLRLPTGPLNTGTMAVPILHMGNVLGVLSLTTFGRLFDSRARFAYFKLLSSTSEALSRAVRDRSSGTTTPEPADIALAEMA